MFCAERVRNGYQQIQRHGILTRSQKNVSDSLGGSSFRHPSLFAEGSGKVGLLSLLLALLDDFGSYYQEAGRAGGDSSPADCVLCTCFVCLYVP